MVFSKCDGDVGQLGLGDIDHVPRPLFEAAEVGQAQRVHVHVVFHQLAAQFRVGDLAQELAGIGAGYRELGVLFGDGEAKCT